MIRTILVPLDGSQQAEAILPYAVVLSTAFNARIVLLRVLESGEVSPGLAADSLHWRLLVAETKRYLNTLRSRLRLDKADAECVVTEGKPVEQILNVIHRYSVDLVVLCCRGDGDSRFPLGKIAQQTISSAGVSLAVIHPLQQEAADHTAAQPFKKILVALDGSKRAEWALHQAEFIASRHGSELVLCHVVVEPDVLQKPSHWKADAMKAARHLVKSNSLAAEEYLNETRGLLVEKGLKCRTHILVSAHVAESIHDLCLREQIDLLVFNAHGQTSLGEWHFGGIAASLIAHSRLSFVVFQDIARPLPEPERVKTAHDLHARMPEVQALQ